jgi:hypothetical protein
MPSKGPSSRPRKPRKGLRASRKTPAGRYKTLSEKRTSRHWVPQEKVPTGPERKSRSHGSGEGAVPRTQLLSESTNEVGHTVQRSVVESGDIVESALDESGNLVDEDIMGNVTELSSEEVYAN